MQYLSNNQIYEISNLLGERIDDIVEHFNLDLKQTNRKWIGKCPIHDGDNPNAFTIYHYGDNTQGNWNCHTHHCEDIFKNSPIGLVRALLSKKLNNWNGETYNIVSFGDACNWSLKFLGKQANDLKIDLDKLEKQKFIRNTNVFSKTNELLKYKITKEQIRQTLQFPAKYLINRGFSPTILDKYDVGFCSNPDKFMYNRCVVPIYDSDGKYMVGCTGRIIYEKCVLCKVHHNPIEHCPTGYLWKYTKWLHSEGFRGENYLYNYHIAKQPILDSAKVFLVESPGNCWKMVEAGENRVVGVFGSSLSASQKTLLDKAGAMEIVVIQDNDSGGDNLYNSILYKCKKTCNIKRIIPSTNDIAEMSIDSIKELING